MPKMGAFIGFGEIGVWANNRERDAFLDWFAEHRCCAGDSRWQYCKSDGSRWTGCGVELSVLIANGEELASRRPRARVLGYRSAIGKGLKSALAGASGSGLLTAGNTICKLALLRL
jgi:hypothetical protein